MKRGVTARGEGHGPVWEKERVRVNGRRLLAALLALWMLSGCGAMTEESTGTSPAAAEESASPGGGGLSASRLEREARLPTEEEILAVYDRAEDAYGWFYLETLPGGQESCVIDGWTYYQVQEPGMETMTDLRAYLRGLFSEELVDTLLSTGGSHPLYQEIEGSLYVLPSNRERNSARGVPAVQIVQVSDTAYTVDVTVDLLDGPGGTATGVASYTFPYELVEGQWVFTDFQMVN